MTFEDAVAEAYEQGWYVYQLGFNPATEGLDDKWFCTLRALSGPPRREISRAYSNTPTEALCEALMAAPEPEEEVKAKLFEGTLPEPTKPKLNLLHTLGLTQPNIPRRGF